VDIGIYATHIYCSLPVGACVSNLSLPLQLRGYTNISFRLREQALNTTFCIDYGQVRSGEDAADTFTRMLQEMTQITAAAAHGIAAEHPTVQELATALRRDGPLALQDCRKTANKNGAFTDRRVGPSISKRLHSVFTSTDEWSTYV
jgi:crossover junction endonuclease EME1